MGEKCKAFLTKFFNPFLFSYPASGKKESQNSVHDGFVKHEKLL